ncbi:hypothetical protein WR25_23527 isoform C [Diploscapter pachys]|uniref:glutathione transferase n=2 Tax=Diploscapter pachys TaxID=2018661 RepID=A0A2A2KWP0_9BILA|nr:hypothetical protein WR25_23527 isoform C [Diploscapter pachys]
MVHYKLYYFDVRGWAEISRQLFALSKTPYEDIQITHEDWPNHKQEMPFEKMPVLSVDGVMIPQSFAIARYLARQFGYAGKSPLEEAMVDALGDQVKDYFNEAYPYFIASHQQKPAEELEKLKNEVFLPARDLLFRYLENFLKKSKSGYLVDSGLTWIDLFVVDHLGTLCGFEPSTLDGHELVRVIFHNIKKEKYHGVNCVNV